MESMSNIPPRRFGSLAAAMITPMTPAGDIDLPSAQRLAIKLVDEGCDTILLSGTTGESPTTHQPEKNDLTDAVREAVGDRAFILCGACFAIDDGCGAVGLRGRFVEFFLQLLQNVFVAQVDAFGIQTAFTV